MKKNFQEQFSNLRGIIEANVSALKGLVAQADSLSEIIQKLNSDTPCDVQLKSQLEELKEKISKSIEVLIEQTEKLFLSYNKLIEEVFGKQ